MLQYTTTMASSLELQNYTHIGSEKGLSSVTTLIAGQKAAVVVVPPFPIPDAHSVVSFITEKTSKPVGCSIRSHTTTQMTTSRQNPMPGSISGSQVQRTWVCPSWD